MPDDRFLKPPLQHYFLDASALVRLVCDEPGSKAVKNLKSDAGSPFLTSWVLLAEALGVLKRKWQREGLGDKDYTDKVQELLIHVRLGFIRPVDLEIINEEPRVKTYEVDIADVRCRHPALDAADALQFRAIKEGILAYYAGESKPRLVSADKKLLAAAIKEDIEIVPVCDD